jgi:ubiquinone/menaquinone biosynthesis C-methylase UbiE
MKPIQDYLLRYLEYLFWDTCKLVYASPQWMMEKNPHAILLDCGCNKGDFSEKVAGILGTSQVIGIELNTTLAQQANRRGIQTLQADLNSSLPLHSESIDVITAFNVVEHLIETQQFIEETYRILKPGGYVVIDTPNLASWHNIAALVMGLQPFSGPNITSMTESDIPLIRRMHRRAHDLPEEMEEFYSTEPERHRHIVVVAYRSLLKAMKRAGFTIEHAVGFGYYPFPPAIAHILSRLDPWHAHHMTIMARKPIG